MSGSAANGRRWLGGAGAWIAIYAATLAAYWPALGAGFVWDDAAHVTKPALQSLPGLGRIWFELGATQQYYPVLFSAFWLEHHLWGESAFGYHLANVLLHATSACLFALVLRRLGSPGAWLAALIFALHPVCVESVAWISEQKNTLSTVFYLLAALAYLRFEETHSGWSALSPTRCATPSSEPARWGQRAPPRSILWWIATVLFVLALLSKTVTATLPAALLVAFWWRRGRLGWREVRPLLPWLVLGAAVGLFSGWVERTYIGASGPIFALTLAQRWLVAGRAVWFYLGRLLWPANLIFIYPRWVVDASVGWQHLFPLAAAAVTIGLWWLRSRARAPLAAWLFFVGSLFPTLGFFNVFAFIYSFVTDHWQYLASLGIIAFAAGGWTRMGTSTPIAAPPGSGRRRAFAGLLGRLRNAGAFFRQGFGVHAFRSVTFAVICLLMVLTWRQCRAYHDEETFYRTIVARNPGSWMAQNNLGNVLVRTQRPAEALPHYEEAARLAPSFAEIEFNRGDSLMLLGRKAEAAAAFQAALRLQPDYAAAHVNLAQTLVSLNRPADAIAHYEQALRLRPADADSEANLGLALASTGRMAEAILHDERALSLKPDSAEAHNNLGSALAASGRMPEAIAQFGEAVRLKPESVETRYNLANALGNAGRLAEAIDQYREILRRQPGHAEGQANLGLALATVGQVPEALAHLAEAVRLRPGYAEAHAYLGFALARAGRLPEAVREYRAALNLNPNDADTHYQLAVALRRLGRTAEAAEEFEAANRPAR